VLEDQREYSSELGQERLELEIPEIRAQVVLLLHQSGRDLIPRDSDPGDGLDDWVHSSWSPSSSQMGAICCWNSGCMRGCAVHCPHHSFLVPEMICDRHKC